MFVRWAGWFLLPSSKLVRSQDFWVRLPLWLWPWWEGRIVRLITLFMVPFNGALSTQAWAASGCPGFDLRIIYAKVLTVWWYLFQLDKKPLSINITALFVCLFQCCFCYNGEKWSFHSICKEEKRVTGRANVSVLRALFFLLSKDIADTIMFMCLN